MKPTVTAIEAYIYNDPWDTSNKYLSCIPIDYPDAHNYRPGAVTNGQRAFTTEIVAQYDDIVETKRTKYKILSWSDRNGI